MQALFYGNRQVEIPVITITIVKEKVKPNSLYLFRCINCGRGVAQHQGKVTNIFPGLKPTEENSVVISCHQSNCDSNYTFQNGITATGTEVTLVNHDPVNTFYCYGCGKPVISYSKTIDQSQSTCIRCSRTFFWTAITTL